MRFTDDQVERAKSVDLISYLEAYEPGNLRHLGHNSICTREHDSLNRPLSDYSAKDRVDVVVANPPFDEAEDASVKQNFPGEFQRRVNPPITLWRSL